MKYTPEIHKTVCGIGINDADYTIAPTENGKRSRCHFYNTWNHMIKRCYSAKYQSKHPTYVGCSVSDEWHSFMAFRKWMEKQNYNGLQLDKDLLVEGNKIYSPEACVFVSSAANNILNDSGAIRGDHPQGVSWRYSSKRYQASLKIMGKTKHIGLYGDRTSAEHAYKKAKSNEIMRVAGLQDNQDVKFALARRAIIMANPPEDSLHKRTEDCGWGWVQRGGK